MSLSPAYSLHLLFPRQFKHTAAATAAAAAAEEEDSKTRANMQSRARD